MARTIFTHVPYVSYLVWHSQTLSLNQDYSSTIGERKGLLTVSQVKLYLKAIEFT